MRQKPGPEKVPAEQIVKDIRRATRRHFSAVVVVYYVIEPTPAYVPRPSNSLSMARSWASICSSFSISRESEVKKEKREFSIPLVQRSCRPCTIILA